MAPNPRVVNAFRAMRAIGITEKQVKPVLKKMLKLYDKNWELIEEENYRALADAIFEEEEAKVPEEKDEAAEGTLEEETLVSSEPELPLKRLRRGQDGQVSGSPSDIEAELGGSPFKKSKVEGKGLAGETSEQQSSDMRISQPKPIAIWSPNRNTSSQTVSPDMRISQPKPIAIWSPNRNTSSQTVSPRRLAVLEHSKQRSNEGKDPLLSEAAAQQKRPNLKGSSQAVHLKDPIVQQGILLSPKQKMPLIKPKDEPFTDDVPFDDAPQPIAIIRPDCARKEQYFNQRVSSLKLHRQERPASRVLAGEGREGNLPVPSSLTRDSCELATIPEEAQANLEIATSALGEERILNVTPALDLMKKSAGVGAIKQNDRIQAYFANRSVDAYCFDGKAALQIPRSLQLSNGLEVMHSREEVIANGCSGSGKEKEFEDAEYGSLIVVPQHQLTADEFRFLNYHSDITKGEEMVEIPWSNEVNSEFPPVFNYIPRNLIFQNAYVNFSLSQIRAENCCSACIGNCLSSSTPCVCSSDSEHGFAYTLEGLVKEDFLEDCISLTRNPQRQFLFYCRDCPLERSKNDEMLEPCKGHLKRKFIKECWSKCGCHKQCGNRVVQRGIMCKLQVFFTPEGKGWGLRTLELLPKGTFVCEYVGEILTNKEFYERKMQRATSNKTEKHAYPAVLDADWCLKGVVNDEEALCLDATFYGNVARFINHRCLDANMIEIPVKIETPDHHYYHLAFFTAREVNALEELTWDYGIDFDDTDQPVELFQCRCGSKFCRNMKRSSSKLILNLYEDLIQQQDDWERG
ncbi:PREDICTED: histone-lysine N-methyltransferase SUVR2 isoform X5 [Populus euphratica]|uniref:Histone-lysine N-methyltransferase SUVR2 isoform X5 n=1 Tax=Populus euphratica TaxID=75702 RepID=A0AAJ6XMK3_POPEU|nr:PREDICTED: histone-lysine N-methyltransferase SUVR2 isoform X5 [Populus euphratica]